MKKMISVALCLALMLTLAACGADVLAVDMDEDVVNRAARYIPYCKCADI